MNQDTCAQTIIKEVQGQPGIHEILPLKKNQPRPGWWCDPEAPALGKQRQKDLQTSQAHIVSLCLTGVCVCVCRTKHNNHIADNTQALPWLRGQGNLKPRVAPRQRPGRAEAPTAAHPRHSPAKLLSHLIMVLNILLPECGHGGCLLQDSGDPGTGGTEESRNVYHGSNFFQEAPPACVTPMPLPQIFFGHLKPLPTIWTR